MISVKELVKTYNNVPVVKNVTFDVNKGEIVGLLGPNGAGKTTIMRILTGYLVPTSGEVIINGKSIFDDPVSIKKIIGYLPEHTPQYKDMTTVEYLSFIAEARGIEKNKIKKAIDEMIELTSLEDVVSKKIGELSKGYQKRVGLASVMIHDPEILILDEPTTGLDPNQVITFRKMMRRLSEKKTVILSTHVLSEIEATCERVIIINKGEIVANNTLQNLINQYNDEIVEFAVQSQESLSKVEAEIPKLKDAWKIEFQKKDARDIYRFKALTTNAEGFEKNLESMVKEKGWKITEKDRNKANLEEIFLKLAGEEE